MVRDGTDRTPAPQAPYSTQEMIGELERLVEDRKLIVQESWRSPRKADRSRKLDPTRPRMSPETVIAFKESPAFRLDVTQDLYRHQVEAIEAVGAGQNVMITTSTASGKSLCYLVPVLDNVLKDPDATALLVFPAVALIQDQLEKVLQLGKDPVAFEEGRFQYDIRIGEAKIGVGLYIGDTKDGMRHQRPVRERARLLFTTPDALHAKILPFIRPTQKTAYASFEPFFRNLQAVVLDEVHVYRGVFGANVAFLIRRLRLLCQKMHSEGLQFILSSATIANPKEHGRNLIGLEVTVVDRDGSESHRKDFVLFNPGKSKDTDARKEPQSEALEILEKVLYAKERTPSSIVFVRSVRGAEKFSKTLEGLSARRKLPAKGRSAVYHGLLSGRDRRARQNEIKSRQVLCVASTNALELGIDIGDLSCAILVGFPDMIASTLQQAGRVGRRGDGTVVLVLGDNPLEQHLARNPAHFFDKLNQPEPVRIPLQNRNIIKAHLLCLMAESSYFIEHRGARYKLPEEFAAFFGPDAVEIYRELLRDRGIQDPSIRKMKRPWCPSIDKEYATIYYTLRAAIGRGRFTLRRSDRPSEDAAGVVDEVRAGLFFHEGAIWLQDGQWYRSEGLDYGKRIITLTPLKDEPEYETVAAPDYEVDFHQNETQTSEWRNGWLQTLYGPLHVERRVRRYLTRPLHRGKKGRSSLQIVQDVEPIPFDTVGLAFVLTPQGERELSRRWHGRGALNLRATVHGVEHALATILPLQARCEVNDVSAVSSESHPACRHRPAVILFDAHDGGLGLVTEAHAKPFDLIDEALAFVKSCPCQDGCPDCLHLPRCERQNEHIHKAGSLLLLEILKEALS